jgi:signal-transduction protein with cAMP-binding, CBS, and nucleotidyltransferase domain
MDFAVDVPGVGRPVDVPGGRPKDGVSAAPDAAGSDRAAAGAEYDAMMPNLRDGRDRSQTAVFSYLVGDFMRTRAEVLAVRPGTRCADMIALLTAEKAGCAVVVDAMGRPIGIITERDIALRIAYRTPPETPVEAVMTAPVMTIQRREYLYHAIAWMRRHELRHMPVIDRKRRLVGLIYLHDALAVAADRLMRQIDRLSHEGTIEGLKEVKAAQIDLAEELFADNLPAPEVQRLLTRINNDMYRRIGEATLRQMAAEGWGDPPVAATIIVMGSGGRGENYLFPDQDNGFIIADYPDADHARIDTFFLEAAERMCRDLNEIGIPYCNGYCMAVNPLWRKTVSQWITQIRLWGRKSNFVAIRLSDIFFDFQPVWGNTDLAQELRHAVTGLVRHNHYFLRQMFQEKVDHNVALGLFGGFITEKEQKEYRGQINLKYTGTIPLVGAVRLLALREGVEETSTLERIRVLTEQGVLSVTDRDDLSAAFTLITGILLKKQISDYRAGRRVSYFVDPDALSKRDNNALRDALKTIDAMRRRVHMEFTAEIF